MKPMMFVFGVPGVGKSTLVRELLGRTTTEHVTSWTIGEDFAALGRYTGRRYDGTDSLPPREEFFRASFHAMNRVVGDRAVLLEGVRFSDLGGELVRVAIEYAGDRPLVALDLCALTSTVHRRRRERRSPVVSDAWIERERGRCEAAIETVRNAGGAHVVVATEQPLAVCVEQARRVAGDRP